MGHRNINITDEVYEMLARLKTPGESFNALLLRLVSGKRAKGTDLSKFYGAWSDVTDEDMTKIEKGLKTFWSTWKVK